jgi:hypothetical protein
MTDVPSITDVEKVHDAGATAAGALDGHVGRNLQVDAEAETLQQAVGANDLYRQISGAHGFRRSLYPTGSDAPSSYEAGAGTAAARREADAAQPAQSAALQSLASQATLLQVHVKQLVQAGAPPDSDALLEHLAAQVRAHAHARAQSCPHTTRGQALDANLRRRRWFCRPSRDSAPPRLQKPNPSRRMPRAPRCGCCLGRPAAHSPTTTQRRGAAPCRTPLTTRAARCCQRPPTEAGLSAGRRAWRARWSRPSR